MEKKNEEQEEGEKYERKERRQRIKGRTRGGRRDDSKVKEENLVNSFIHFDEEEFERIH